MVAVPHRYIIEDLRVAQVNHIIVAGGSNYRTLRANNIRVDFLTLVERADYDFD